jgi:alpha-L-arabinofuranosidase
MQHPFFCIDVPRKRIDVCGHQNLHKWIAINWAEEIMLATPQQVQYCHMTNYPVHLKFHKFKGFSTNFANDYHGFATH